MKNRILLVLICLLFGSTMIYAQSSVPRCTEQQLPYTYRKEYINQASRYIENYYNQLLFNVNNVMVQKAFIRTNMDESVTRYKPEFLLEDKTDAAFLSPQQYLMELDKAYKLFDTEKLEFVVDNITITPNDFYLPNLVSCYVIAEYDLTVKHEGHLLFSRKCRAYCLFPNIAVNIEVKMLQIEPVQKQVTASAPETSHSSSAVTPFNYTNADYQKAMALYDKGEYKQALDIFYKLDEKKNSDAQNMIGNCYFMGYGKERDYHFAYLWYNRAAQNGNVYGMVNVAKCYQFGYGVAKNPRMAKQWYSKAADLGNQDAISALRTFNSSSSSNTNISSSSNSSSYQNSSKTSTAMGWVKYRNKPAYRALVKVMDTEVGILTDKFGKFTLYDVPEGATLQISFVGCPSSYVKWEGKVLYVELEDF